MENHREISRCLRAVAAMNHEKEKWGELTRAKERSRDIEKTKKRNCKV